MADQITTAVATATAPTSKELRKKFGVHKTALVVPAGAVAYSKKMNFDEKFSIPGTPEYVDARSWVILDPSRGKLIRANTYNGNLGDRADYLNPANIKDLPADESKDRRKALKGYEPIALSEVPFVTVVESTTPPTTPPAEDEKSE